MQKHYEEDWFYKLLEVFISYINKDVLNGFFFYLNSILEI